MNAQTVVDHVCRETMAGRYEARIHDVECRCPACGKDGCFAINPESGLYGGFKCGLRGCVRGQFLREPRWGRVRSLLTESPGVYTGLAPVGLSGSGGLTVPPLHRVQGKAIPGDGGHGPWTGLHDRVRAYAMSRGITAGAIDLHGLCYSPGLPRLFFPHWVGEELTFWMGRSIDGSEPKTLEPPGAEKPLYGLQVYGPEMYRDTMVLVEGVFDYFATPTSLAVMGSNLSAIQRGVIGQIRPRRVLVLFDPDATEKALAVCRLLWRDGHRAEVLEMEGGKDPADCGSRVMGEVISRLGDVRPVRPRVRRVPLSWLDSRSPC